MGERRKSTCLLPGRHFSGSVSFQPVERTRILSLPPPYMAPGAERTPVHRRAILLDARTRTDSFKGWPQRHTAILPAQIQGFKQTRRLHPSDHRSGRHRFRTHRHPVCKLTQLRNKTPHPTHLPHTQLHTPHNTKYIFMLSDVLREVKSGKKALKGCTKYEYLTI